MKTGNTLPPRDPEVSASVRERDAATGEREGEISRGFAKLKKAVRSVIEQPVDTGPGLTLVPPLPETPGPTPASSSFEARPVPTNAEGNLVDMTRRRAIQLAEEKVNDAYPTVPVSIEIEPPDTAS